jgi:tRNA A-37 threonylcarbamoyl transferase component Bud32/tetratricopeptide (TPR) repeat protein
MDDSATVTPSSAARTAPGEDPAADPFLGKVIGERYSLQGRIGEGGMGLVYRAQHTLMKKTVAVKLLHGELGQVGEAVRRFEREAQSASRLNHPNIIAVTDFGQTATGEFYLVMEYVPGLSLGQALAVEPHNRMSVGRALGIVRQMLSGLAHAHAQGVVHRDLKPANIMLTRSVDGRDDVVKILDFGIAKMMTEAAAAGAAVEPGEPASPAATQNTMVFGTPSYMSPEQATGTNVDSRADLYSCGVILFELLTGRKPFVANELARILAMHVTAPPPRFAAVAPEARLPAALEDVVLHALEKDPARRYQTAGQFAAALESLETAIVPQALAAAAVVRGRRALVGARVISTELLALYARLPAEFRRWTPLFGVLGVVLALVIVPTLCFRAANLGQPPPPRPVAEVVTQPLQEVEAAMARGRFEEARARLLQLLTKYPSEARVHFTVGHLEYVEKKFPAALAAYDRALDLDPGLRGDAGLLLNVRALSGDRDKKVALAAVALAADKIGTPAAPLLAEIASEDGRIDLRSAARDACDKLGCSGDIDLAKSLAQDLAQARTCDEKRAVVRRLATARPPRAAEVLKKARAIRGALGGLLGGGNECVRKDIDAALADLGG